MNTTNGCCIAKVQTRVPENSSEGKKKPMNLLGSPLFFGGGGRGLLMPLPRNMFWGCPSFVHVRRPSRFGVSAISQEPLEI